MASAGEDEEQPSLQQVEMEVEDGETVAGSWAFIVGEVTNHGED